MISTNVSKRIFILIILFSVVLVGCGGTQPTPAKELTPVSIQMPWVTQSQFAGYYAAADQGYYKEEGLDVKILEGAVDIVPEQIVASGVAQFGVASLPKVLVAREQGAHLVNIAQVFQRSGSRMMAFASTGIKTISDLKGKKVGNWGYGNEFELLAALDSVGLDSNKDLTLVQQQFDVSDLLNHQVDAEQAEIYNEYAQVLESVNPATGQLYQPSDLTVIDFADFHSSLLEDQVFTNETWLATGNNQDVAVRFLRATFRGWIYCRDNFDACVNMVLTKGPTLGRSHMTWQLNEVNNLIWPSPYGIGVMDPVLWNQTVRVGTSTGLLKAVPDKGAYRTDLAEQALSELKTDGLDVIGNNFQKLVVTLKAGGE